MNSRFSFAIAVSLIGFTLACSSGGPPYVRTPADSDMASFKKYVNLPEPPKAVTFETYYRAKPSAVPGPSDWSLTAVLTYDSSALLRIKARTTIQNEPVMLMKSEVRPWFPQVIRDRLIESSGQGLRFSESSYKATPFLKPPLNDGEFVTPDGSGYLFLQMDCCGPVTEPSSVGGDAGSALQHGRIN